MWSRKHKQQTRIVVPTGPPAEYVHGHALSIMLMQKTFFHHADAKNVLNKPSETGATNHIGTERGYSWLALLGKA